MTADVERARAIAIPPARGDRLDRSLHRPDRLHVRRLRRTGSLRVGWPQALAVADAPAAPRPRRFAEVIGRMFEEEVEAQDGWVLTHCDEAAAR